MALSCTTRLLFTVLAAASASVCKDTESPTCGVVPDDHVNFLQGRQKLKQRGLELSATSKDSGQTFVQRMAMIKAADRFFAERALMNATASAAAVSGACADNSAKLLTDLGLALGGKDEAEVLTTFRIQDASKACSELAGQRWCMSPDKAAEGNVEEWMGEVCPKSCNWCECTDHVDQFNVECHGDPSAEPDPIPANDMCKEKFPNGAGGADPCGPAAAAHWCNADATEGNAALLAAAKWMIFLCRKSCCDHWEKNAESMQLKVHPSCAKCKAEENQPVAEGEGEGEAEATQAAMPNPAASGVATGVVAAPKVDSTALAPPSPPPPPPVVQSAAQKKEADQLARVK